MAPEIEPSERRRRGYELRAEESLGEGLRRIALGRAERAARRLRGAEPGTPGFAAAVHGARKDLKKLRTVLRLLREELGRERFRAGNERFRDAGRALSASRDAEVKLATLEALGEAREGDLPAGSHAWRQALEGERATAGGADGAAVATALRLIEEGRGEIASWDLGDDDWDLIAAGLKRGYRDGRRAMRAVAAESSQENVHEWRKRAKDLWYELRILRGTWPELLGPGAEEAHRLSESLGDHHDLAVLRADLAGRGFEEPQVAALEAAIDARQEQLTGAALALGRRLYAEPPKRFRRRLRRYWDAWRE